MMKKKIDFISAVDGQLAFYSGSELVFADNCSFRIGVWLAERPQSLWNASHSSSLDFASEYGFESNEAAWDLLKESVRAANIINFTEDGYGPEEIVEKLGYSESEVLQFLALNSDA